jgi:hypothetical protein
MNQLARHGVLFLALLGLTGSAAAQDVTDSGASEHLTKARYIYNFAKLVEWPASAARSGQALVIGVLGNDPFAAVLERVVQGKKIDDRALTVKRLTTPAECGCQILFVADSENGRIDEITRLQSSASVLTISEAPDFARRGGIIALILEDSRVRFLVNVDAASQASLTISSRLLTLASVVQSTP